MTRYPGRTLRLGLIASLVAIVVSGCSPGDRPTGENVPLRVQIFNGAYSSIPVHVAHDKGFYAKHGLEIEKIASDSSSAAIAAMIGGSLDIVESAADLVLANVDKGTDLKYLMSNEGRNYTTLVVSNEVALRNESSGYPGLMQDF